MAEARCEELKPGTHQLPENVEVQHIATGAVGVVIKGGYRPQVRWDIGRRSKRERISRVDGEELRLTGYGSSLWIPDFDTRRGDG